MSFINFTKTIHDFFNEFAPSFFESDVPRDVVGMYGTYNLTTPAKYEDTILNYNLYDLNTSLVNILTRADEISAKIGDGIVIPCNGGGTLWIKKGDPFQQVVKTEDGQIKSVYMNIVVNYLI